MTKYIPLVLTVLIAASCSNLKTHDQIKEQPYKVITIKSEPKIIIREVVRIERQIDTSQKNSSLDNIYELELDYKKKHFDFWVNYFSKREKARFLRHARNGAKYRNVISKILESHGLPQDLFYVGLIESGYNMRIRSHASAVGPWQFIKGTATRYGLRVDKYVDERSHIIKATEAAASYFKDLYNIFGSWELALSAYNAGEYRIIRAIRKGNTRDYKTLVKLKLLPKETIYYVPKVAAAREIYNNPDKYAIKLPSPKHSPFESVKSIKVAGSFDLFKKAKELGISISTLKKLNPDLRKRWVSVSRRRRQSLFIPSQTYTNYDKLANLEVKRINKPSVARQKNKRGTYKVRKGDNLFKISRRLGVKVSTLKKLNKIKGSRIYIGQRLKTSRRIASNTSSRNLYHTVKKGQTLSWIARRYKTSVRTLMRNNGLAQSRIRIGQRLRLGSKRNSRYKVRKGDNLGFISRKFGVTLVSLKRKNRLKSNLVFSGQILRIPSEG